MAISVSSATLSPSFSFAAISRTTTSPPPSLSFSAASSSFFNNALTQKTSAFRIPLPSRLRSGSGLSCTCLFGLGVPELVVIAGVAALVFGPKKLPEVGRSIGKTVKSFQQAAKEFESELKKEPDSATEAAAAAAEKPAAAIEEERQESKVSSTKESL